MGSFKVLTLLRLLVLVSVSCYVVADVDNVPAVQAVIEAKTTTQPRSLRAEGSGYSFLRSLTEIFDTAWYNSLQECPPGCIAWLGHDDRCMKCKTKATCTRDTSVPNPRPCANGCVFGYSGFFVKLLGKTGAGGCVVGCQVKKCLSAGSINFVGSGGGGSTKTVKPVTLTNPKKREVRITWDKTVFANTSGKVTICRSDKPNNCKTKSVSSGTTKDSSVSSGRTYTYTVCTKNTVKTCKSASITLPQ